MSEDEIKKMLDQLESGKLPPLASQGWTKLVSNGFKSVNEGWEVSQYSAPKGDGYVARCDAAPPQEGFTRRASKIKPKKP